ncbi:MULTISPECIES: gamma-glutamylcyclotransferase [unclassified Aeromicrobium]|uniref:gamma-glutamylcyclotransferase family protein n=1 Tax=unclassified Aeromicrobium TaxID=2633570 RepID=UPI00396B0DA0
MTDSTPTQIEDDETMTLDVTCRLATYGTLAPGRANAAQLEELDGRWTDGVVRGRLIEEGWGAAQGFPALLLDPPAGTIDVVVFESADLPEHWARLDEFEGPEYRRVAAPIDIGTAVVDAFIYVAASGVATTSDLDDV